MGRPTKLTKQVQDRIVSALKLGNYLATATEYAGIEEQTYYNWMERGKEEREGIYFEFFEAVRGAISEAEVSLVARWQKIINEQPNNHYAIKDFLERRYRDRWGNNQNINITDKTDYADQVKKIEEFKKMYFDKND